MSDPLAPIVLEIHVGLSAARAWALFTDLGRWWPIEQFSLSRDPATRCRMEAAVGGAITERAPDGSVHAWGEVLALREGRALRFSWHPGREPATAQWVDLRFEDEPGGCRVRLEHGGWDALGEIAPILRREYGPGWERVLGGCYRDCAAAAATGAAPSR